MDSDSSDSSENVGIAFALVIGAGAATALGAGVVFIPWAVKYANRKTLAAALGLSAGVMTYVSFVEILQKSVVSFADAGMNEKRSYRYATICFFSGVICMVALNKIVTKLLRGEHHHHHSHGGDITPPGDDINHTTNITDSLQSNTPTPSTHQPSQRTVGEPQQEEVAGCICCSEDPARDLESLKHMAEEVQHSHEHASHDHGGHDHVVHQQDIHESNSSDSKSSEQDENQSEEKEDGGEAHDEAKLMRMSLNTALAIGLHNFPEGLATFVATLNDPKVGAVLAIAIAIHNIPEGLCVAMPIYYATGKRWKAFAWACLSGASEPVAALLGWIVLANSFNDTTYAVLFGMVAGMMVVISARELLPTAHRYDPEDSVVTFSFIGGMMIMAASLVLFVETT